MNDKLLSVDQVSEYLGVHRDTVYAMVRSGRLPALQLGGRKASWRISESDLMAFLAERKAAGARGDGAVESAEVTEAAERAAFDREQDREREEFDGRQKQRLADFQAGQQRRRDSGEKAGRNGAPASDSTAGRSRT